ncbi:MAG: cobyrinic acid a,c-diamide synthase, partial [Pseudomonadota bacterium]
RHGSRRIALAEDAAFSFTYAFKKHHWWRDDTLLPFSPLADDPVPEADLVILPGGYPELHADTLARAQTFKQSLREASLSVDISGECGGYMALGEALVDADGVSHEMAGLLPLVTSFAERRLHLGYRRLKARHGPQHWRGHEFHYATTLRADGTPAFDAWDAEGNALPPMGLVEGRVSGSFAHIIA